MGDFIVVVGQKFAHKTKEPLLEVWKKSNYLGYNLSLLKGKQPDEDETNTCPQRENKVPDLIIGKYTISSGWLMVGLTVTAAQGVFMNFVQGLYGCGQFEPCRNRTME